MWAADCGHVEVVRLLQELGAAKNLQSMASGNFLHMPLNVPS
jgi:hypothetical protein